MNSSAGDQGVHRPARRHDLHLVQRRSARCEWAFEQRPRAGKVLFLPDQHLGRNTAVLRAGALARRLRALRPAQAGGGLTAAAAARRPGDPVARALLACTAGSPRVGPRRPRAGARASTCWCTPSAGTRSSTAADHGRLDRVDHPDARRPRRPGRAWAIGTELNLVRRLARAAPRQADHVPRQDGVLLLDDEPDRPAAPGVGARVARRGPGAQPDPGRGRDRALGPGRARPDARAARPHAPRLTRRRGAPTSRLRRAGSGPTSRDEPGPPAVCRPREVRRHLRNVITSGGWRGARAGRPRPGRPARTRPGAGSRRRRARGCRGPRRR